MKWVDHFGSSATKHERMRRLGIVREAGGGNARQRGYAMGSPLGAILGAIVERRRCAKLWLYASSGQSVWSVITESLLIEDPPLNAKRRQSLG